VLYTTETLYPRLRRAADEKSAMDHRMPWALWAPHTWATQIDPRAMSERVCQLKHAIARRRESVRPVHVFAELQVLLQRAPHI